MTCSACGAKITIDNDSCEVCGTDQRRARLPAKRQQPQSPALWHQAAPVVVRGVALVAAGLIGEWLLRSVAKKAITAPFSRATKEKRDVGRPIDSHDSMIAISETLVMRRVIVRR